MATRTTYAHTTETTEDGMTIIRCLYCGAETYCSSDEDVDGKHLRFEERHDKCRKEAGGRSPGDFE